MRAITHMNSNFSFALVLAVAVQWIIGTAGRPDFICDDGKVISQTRFCGRFVDCHDGSDERSPELATDESNITSLYLKCSLPRTLGVIQTCAIRRTEFCRGQTQCIGKTLCDGWCPGHYRCPDGSCRPRATVCDGGYCNDCPSERRFGNGHGFKCVRNGRQCNLPQVLLLDGIADCDDGSDLCFASVGGKLIGDPRDIRNRSEGFFNSSNCFFCRDERNTIIARSNVCDGMVDCPNMKDECDCDEDEPVACRHVSDYAKQPTLVKRCQCFDTHGICRNHVRKTNASCFQSIPPACNLAKPCNTDFPCDMLCPSHFRCPDMTCRARSTVCDGHVCNDCASSQSWRNGHGFKCARNGRLCDLPQVLLYDGVSDCDDASDLCYVAHEGGGSLIGNPRDIRQSVFAKFNTTICHMCGDNQTIISRRSVCDDVIDCPDMSDECHCEGKSPDLCRHATSYAANPTITHECQCFDDSGVCLNHLHPPQNSAAYKKLNCTKTKRQICEGLVYPCDSDAPCNMQCPTHYRCPDYKCLPRSTVCDDDTCNDCPQHGRWTNGPGFKCTRNGRRCVLPQMLLWDGVKDCDDGGDLCYLDGKGVLADNPNDIRSSIWAEFNRSLCFLSLDGDTIIPKSSVCDDVIDCDDMSDECLCEGRLPDLCARIQPHLTSVQVSANCSGGKYKCQDGKCIGRESVCDGTMDCEDGSDEMSKLCDGTAPCNNQSIPGQICRCSDLASKTCERKTATFCDGRSECVASQGSNRLYDSPAEDECTETCQKAKSVDRFGVTNQADCSDQQQTPLFECSDMYAKPILCNGVIECNNAYFNDDYVYHDEDPTICTSKYQCDTVNGFVNVDKLKVCDGFVDCIDGSDERRDLCQDRLYCLSLGGAAMSIGKQQICDGNVNCDSAEDELSCTNDGRFYCENGQPLFVAEELKFNGVGDCSDWSDECPSAGQPEGLLVSSKYELIANPILRAAVWLMGIAATFGNLAVMIKELRPATQSRDRHASSRTNHILVLNLSASDFLMGMYLIVLGIMGAQYSGAYCSSDLTWRSSGTCTTLGVLVTVSSETSVLTMVLLTTFRLYAVFKPFQASSSPSTTTVVCCVMMAWSISLLIALLPLTTAFQEMFETRAWIKGNLFFRDVTVDVSSMKDFLGRLAMFYPMHNDTDFAGIWKNKDISDVTSWPELYSALIQGGYRMLDEPSGYFGYYSTNSVCISKLFVTLSDSAWSYSLSVMIFNFVAFAYVALSYFIIYRISARSRKKVDAGQRSRVSKKNKDMQTKILILIFTDFCSWVPLSAMTFLHFGGVTLPSVAYVISAVVLLPINSAINPLIYSTALDKLRKRVVESVSDAFRTQNTEIRSAQM